ncbi:hypothetical protein AOLI_G00041400 [Acnodon oligacanthus]
MGATADVTRLRIRVTGRNNKAPRPAPPSQGKSTDFHNFTIRRAPGCRERPDLHYYRAASCETEHRYDQDMTPGGSV